MLGGLTNLVSSIFAGSGTLAVGAGLLAGAITGGALVVTGTLPGSPPAQLALRACPDAGPVLAYVTSGESLLVTARNEEASWVEVFVGDPRIERGWAPSSALRFTEQLATLPIGSCSVEPPGTPAPLPSPAPTDAPTPTPEPTIIATVGPTFTLAPGQTPTPTPKPTPSPKPSPTAAPTPTPSPTPLPPPPTPTADLTPPALVSFSIVYPSPFNGSYYIGSLPCSPPNATMRATFSDAAGIAWVRLYYKPNGLGTSFITMTNMGSYWEGGITGNGSWPTGEVGLWVAAQDNNGNTSSQFPYGNPNSTADSSLIWDPFCIT